MLVLIGEEDSKRTEFIKKAAADLGVRLQVITWNTLQRGFDLLQLKGAVVKIDPPSYCTIDLSQMREQLEEYQNILERLEQAECRFLNSPNAVCQMLDKRDTKLRLEKNGIPVTEMFQEEIMETEQLTELMKQRKCYSVFVKPRYFSGAAGVAAFRIHPLHGRMKLYTSCRYLEGKLVNTKKLYCMDSREEICLLLNKLLSLGCVIERWHPKADIQGKSYDLRVVFQFGHIAYMVVRQSKGPITNLHLNNQAMDIQALGLDESTVDRIGILCKEACLAFSGLSMAGIDILLEKGTMRPLIIEMNGQGDLIYRDIYGENQIYREQVRELCRQ